jgi:hypothetical protein
VESQRALRTEIAKIRSAKPELAAIRTDTEPLAQMKAELAEKHMARLAAENRVAELLDLKNKVETEVVISLGSVIRSRRKSENSRCNPLRLTARWSTWKTCGRRNAPRFGHNSKLPRMANGSWPNCFNEIPRLERVPEKPRAVMPRCMAKERLWTKTDAHSWKSVFSNGSVNCKMTGSRYPSDQRKGEGMGPAPPIRRTAILDLAHERSRNPKVGGADFENLLGLNSQQGTPTWYEFVTSGAYETSGKSDSTYQDSFVALILVMCAGLAIGIWLFYENHALKAELATLRSVPNQSAPDRKMKKRVWSRRSSTNPRAQRRRGSRDRNRQSLPAMSNEEWALARTRRRTRLAGERSSRLDVRNSEAEKEWRKNKSGGRLADLSG